MNVKWKIDNEMEFMTICIIRLLYNHWIYIRILFFKIDPDNAILVSIRPNYRDTLITLNMNVKTLEQITKWMDEGCKGLALAHNYTQYMDYFLADVFRSVDKMPLSRS